MKALMTHEMKILVATLAVVSSSAFAQDYLVSETEEILNSEQIDIDGQFRRESAADKVEKMRKRLEKQNEEMVQKKIEDIRIKNEQKLATDLKGAFNGQAIGTDQEVDTVETVQAAPQTIIAPAPIIEEADYKNAIIPFLGIKQYEGDDIDGFESEMNAGITFENEISNRFRIGIGATYTTLDFTDTFYDEEISTRNINLNLTGKFFLATESSIRPYLGLGLGYNRMNLEYDTELSGEKLEASGSNVNGSGSVGVEFAFAKNLGLNIDFTYSRALTSGFDENDSVGTRTFITRDNLEDRLENYGNALEESNVAALNIGFLIKF